MTIPVNAVDSVTVLDFTQSLTDTQEFEVSDTDLYVELKAKMLDTVQFQPIDHSLVSCFYYEVPVYELYVSIVESETTPQPCAPLDCEQRIVTDNIHFDPDYFCFSDTVDNICKIPDNPKLFVIDALYGDICDIRYTPNINSGNYEYAALHYSGYYNLSLDKLDTDNHAVECWYSQIGLYSGWDSDAIDVLTDKYIEYTAVCTGVVGFLIYKTPSTAPRLITASNVPVSEYVMSEYECTYDIRSNSPYPYIAGYYVSSMFPLSGWYSEYEQAYTAYLGLADFRLKRDSYRYSINTLNLESSDSICYCDMSYLLDEDLYYGEWKTRFSGYPVYSESVEMPCDYEYGDVIKSGTASYTVDVYWDGSYSIKLSGYNYPDGYPTLIHPSVKTGRFKGTNSFGNSDDLSFIKYDESSDGLCYYENGKKISLNGDIKLSILGNNYIVRRVHPTVGKTVVTKADDKWDPIITTVTTINSTASTTSTTLTESNYITIRYNNGSSMIRTPSNDSDFEKTVQDYINQIEEENAKLKAENASLKSEYCSVIGDVDGDSKVTIKDVRYTLKYYTYNTVAGLNISWNQIIKT